MGDLRELINVTLVKGSSSPKVVRDCHCQIAVTIYPTVPLSWVFPFGEGPRTPQGPNRTKTTAPETHRSARGNSGRHCWLSQPDASSRHS